MTKSVSLAPATSSPKAPTSAKAPAPLKLAPVSSPAQANNLSAPLPIVSSSTPTLVPAGARPLKGHALLGLGLVLLGLGLSGLGVAAVKPERADGLALAQAAEASAVEVTGVVVALRASRNGRPLLTLELPDGFVATVYVADDARAPALQLGHKYAIQAHVQGTLLVADIAGGVKALPRLGRRAVTAFVDERNWAYLQTAEGTVRLPAPTVSPGLQVGELLDNGRASFGGSPE